MHATRGSSRAHGQDEHQAGRRREPVTTTDTGPALAGTLGNGKPWTLLIVLSVAQFMVILDRSSEDFNIAT